MKQIKYRGDIFNRHILEVDVHEYLDGCGRLRLVFNDYKYWCYAEESFT